MSIMTPFKSVGHFFATLISKGQPLLVSLIKTQTAVETVTSIIPGAQVAVTVEKLGYAVLGELMAVVHSSGDAARAKLLDAGMDATVLHDVEALLAASKQFAALIKTETSGPNPNPAPPSIPPQELNGQVA